VIGSRLAWRRVDERRVLEPREVLKVVPVAALAAAQARPASAQSVKWSAGTEAPRLKAPANATDCHHHIYNGKYLVDPKATLRPADALVDDYRALQRRIGTTRTSSCSLRRTAPTIAVTSTRWPVWVDCPHGRGRQRGVSTEDSTHARAVPRIRFNLARPAPRRRDDRAVVQADQRPRLAHPGQCPGRESS